jgi:hypothetical protein
MKNLPKLHILDRPRAEERVAIHFGGNVEYLLDLTRSCIPLELEQTKIFLSLKVGDPVIGGEKSLILVDIRDRISKPSPEGFMDLKLQVVDESGYISTLRIFPYTSFESFFTTSLHAANFNVTTANHMVESGKHFVIVCDNFNHLEEKSRTLVTGFPSEDAAIDYAEKRANDCICYLSVISRSIDDLKDCWVMFGEEIFVGAGRGDSYSNVTSTQLFKLLIEGPVSNNRNWVELNSRYDLCVQALPDLMSVLVQ